MSINCPYEKLVEFGLVNKTIECLYKLDAYNFINRIKFGKGLNRGSFATTE